MRVRGLGRPGPPDSYGRRRLVLGEVGDQLPELEPSPRRPPPAPPGRNHLVIAMPGPGQEIRLVGVPGSHPRPDTRGSDRGFRTGWGQSQSVRDKETEEADTGKGAQEKLAMEAWGCWGPGLAPQAAQEASAVPTILRLSFPLLDEGGYPAVAPRAGRTAGPRDEGGGRGPAPRRAFVSP